MSFAPISLANRSRCVSKDSRIIKKSFGNKKFNNFFCLKSWNVCKKNASKSELQKNCIEGGLWGGVGVSISLIRIGPGILQNIPIYIPVQNQTGIPIIKPCYLHRHWPNLSIKQYSLAWLAAPVQVQVITEKGAKLLAYQLNHEWKLTKQKHSS